MVCQHIYRYYCIVDIGLEIEFNVPVTCHKYCDMDLGSVDTERIFRVVEKKTKLYSMCYDCHIVKNSENEKLRNEK